MPSKPELPEAEWNFTRFYGLGKEEFRKLLYYYEFGREYYNREHEKNEESLAEIVEYQIEKNPVSMIYQNLMMHSKLKLQLLNLFTS